MMMMMMMMMMMTMCMRSSNRGGFKGRFKCQTVGAIYVTRHTSHVTLHTSHVTQRYAGSFYDDHVLCSSSSSSSSEQFPTLDASNFPSLPATKKTNAQQQQQQQQQQHRASKQPIILQFASLPRAHRIQVPPTLPLPPTIRNYITTPSQPLHNPFTIP